jgi:hypothetical protein
VALVLARSKRVKVARPAARAVGWSTAAAALAVALAFGLAGAFAAPAYVDELPEDYIPCSLGFPPGKTWHEDAVKDGRAILRIDGRRYPVELAKLEASAVQQLEGVLRAEIERKYGRPPPTDAGVWIFRVDSRLPAS